MADRGGARQLRGDGDRQALVEPTQQSDRYVLGAALERGGEGGGAVMMLATEV